MADLALQVSALSFELVPGGPKLLTDVCFELPQGARCVLVGQNGAGKSTFLELLAGQKMAPTGTVKVCGADPFRGASGRQVALIQGGWRGNSNDGMSEERMTFLRVWQFLGLSGPELGKDGEAPDARAERLYEVLGLRRLLDRYCGSLSDGERRKTELARKLAEPKQVVLLDEATTDLDLLSRRSLLDFLSSDGQTVVSVTHVFDGLEDWATHLALLHDGALLRREEVAQDGPKPWDVNGGLFPLVSAWINEAAKKQALPALPQELLEQPVAAAEGPNDPAAVQVTGLSFSYATWCPVALKVDDLEIPRGCRCVLVGPNGAGKSSLLNILAGRRMVTEGGEVRVLGHQAFHDHTVLDPMVTLLSSEWKRQVAELTIGRSLSFRELSSTAMQDLVASGHEMQTLARRMLRLIQILGLDPAKPVGSLSDGMMRRVQIALKLLRPSKVLLVDEVTADLDVVARQALLGFLREEAAAGCAIIYCTHIMDGLDGWASHLLRLRPGGHQGQLLPLGGAEARGTLLQQLLGMLEEDASLPEPPPPKAAPRSAATKASPELPSGWSQRGATQAGNYGNYGWNADAGSEDTWSFKSVAPAPGAARPARDEQPMALAAAQAAAAGSVPGMPGMPGMPAGSPGMAPGPGAFGAFGGAHQAAPRVDDNPFGPGVRNNTMGYEGLVAAGVIKP